MITFDTPPYGVAYYWQGTDPNGTLTAVPVNGVFTIGASGNYYFRALCIASQLWSQTTKVSSIIDPVDVTVDAYEPINSLVQATHSITLSPGFTATATASNTFNARILITTECNDLVNWTEQIAYDQNGNPIGRSKAYQDGFGSNIQTQTIDYINNKVWASQPIFDQLNNPSANTMAAPILAYDFIYKNNFVQNQAGQTYSAADFDLPISTNAAGEINNPKPVGNAPGTLGWYYSSANTEEPKTPATAFPYSRSYTPPGPNPLTSKSAGVGENNKMGSGHETQGDKYVFGPSALSHYALVRPSFTSNTSPLQGYISVGTDPNGKKAATFTDADGRTLASAIITSGTSPSNFVYSDWSYSFYNDVGQLVASVAPQGITTSVNSITTFITYYKYDHLGRLIETTSPDEGTSRFVYSTDGKIRFSENQEQRNATPKRFSYTNYDYLGRLVESGEYTCSGTNPYKFEPHTIATPSTYSVLNIVDNVGYTGTTGSAGDARCKETNYIQYDVPATDYPTDALHPLQANLIGQVVRTKNDNTTTWYSYDEFGQLTWMKQSIVGLGTKTVDYTYDYFGNVTTVAYQQSQPDAFYHHYEYDKTNRLTTAYTSLDGATKTLQAKYYYYLHGPLKRVELGGNVQGIDYVYNIDGSLKLINHPDPTQDPGNDGPNGFKPDLFGMALDYNSTDYVGAGYNPGSFSVGGTDQYGGAIKAQRWHSQVDSHAPRAYTYGYDGKYQLATSTFGNVTGGSGSYGYTPSPVSAYQENIGGYDKNGNIQSLSRKNKLGSSIASFAYSYKANTNQLTSIVDNANTVLSYQYNTIGQMTQQTEGVNTMKVSYTAYGLTKEIRDGSNVLKVAFAYDDRGNRVKKTAYTASGAVANVTYYVSDAAGNTLAIYEQDVANNRPLAQTEIPVYAAGRVGVYKPPFQTVLYEVDDHLGNVRGVVGKPMTVPVTATYETATWATEQTQFLRTESARRINSTLFDHTKTTGASYSQRLSGSANEKYGIARPIAVLPGDVVSAEVYAKYVDPNRSNWNAALVTLMAQIANGTAGVVVDGPSYPTPQTFPYPDLNGTGSSTGTGPKAYLNWLVFDKNFTFNPSLSGYRRMSSTAKEQGQNAAHERLYSPDIMITEPGYVYIYISNEEQTPIDVFFDDFKVTQNMSEVVAGADYYPFGLPIPERELTREPYRYGYQGQYSEKDRETGFNFFDLRMYDARIGRWVSPDPYGQYASGYVGMGNMPNMGIDPDGGLFGLSAGWSALVGAGIGFGLGAGAALLTGHDDDWLRWGLYGAAAGAVAGYATGDAKVTHGSSNARSKTGGSYHTNEYKGPAAKSIGKGARFVEWQELTFTLARTTKQLWDREEEYSRRIKFKRNTKKTQFEFSEIWGTAEQSVSRNGDKIWKRTNRKDDYSTPIFDKKGGNYIIKHKQKFPSKPKPESMVNEDGDVVGESDIEVYPTLDLQVTIRRLIHGRRGKTLSHGWRRISAPN
jgi:RHS repeat-associated protein